MRRPLFTTGIPQRALFDDSIITVFDTTDYTPQAAAPQAYAVTLFVWAYGSVVLTGVGDVGKLPRIGVNVTSDNDAGITVAERYPADFVAAEVVAAASVARPVKLLDGFIVRGDQQITVANTNTDSTVANEMSCFVFGYFEAVGEAPTSKPFRPLMPTALEAPFSATPALVTVIGAGAGAYGTAHMLSATYKDELTLRTNLATSIEYTDATAFVRFPGGTLLPVPFNNSGLPAPNVHALFGAEIFDGIPLIAPSSSSNLIEVGFGTSGAGGNTAIAGFGGFRRG